MNFDEVLLDDPTALAEADTRQLLPVTAGAGASIRASAALVDTDVIGRIADEGRPRAVVVVGGGGSRAAGEILTAVAGSGSPIPVVTVGGPSLPGWVGPTDLVIAVSASGGTPETTAVAAEAGRRGCRLLAICPDATPMSELVAATRSANRLGIAIPPIGGRWRARSLMWSLAAPLLIVGGSLGLVEDARLALASAADQLDDVADACSPSRDTVNNLAKRWAFDMALSLPMLWGTGSVGGVAVSRFGRQLAENAGLPSVIGTLPEAARTQSVLLAGPRAGAPDSSDLFRDRVEEPEAAPRLRLVLLRDSTEDPSVAALAEAGIELAQLRGVPVSVIQAEPGHPLNRLVSLVAITDFASVYAGLALGQDPLSTANELNPRS